MISNIDNNTEEAEAKAFIRDLVIAKTGIDYDQISLEDQAKLGTEVFENYISFIEAAVSAVGDEAQKKHWAMYKTSGLSPKLLETLATLKTTISELTTEYINL